MKSEPDLSSLNNEVDAETSAGAQENPEFLHSQLVTYIGNKRALLNFIGEGVSIVHKELGKQKLICLDAFSGSGAVSRYLKRHSSYLAVNDMELYSGVINRCYLANRTNLDMDALRRTYDVLTQATKRDMDALEPLRKNADEGRDSPGFITRLYSPADESNILKSDRCFYTRYNANYLDVCRQNIEKLVPQETRDLFIAPLLSEASIHANTAGIFKGFYKNPETGSGQFGGRGKNALSRIMGKIELPFPVFSNFDCESRIFNRDTNGLVADDVLYDFPPSVAGEDFNRHEFDLAYFDPPYNQHPYGSNYFMLNLIASYNPPDPQQMSRVSGIPKDWNRSLYNKKKQVLPVFFELIKNVRAKFVLISFNSEGFIPKDEMIRMLSECGTVHVLESKYNAFRGSRNLHAREIHVKEYLFLLDKRTKR